MVFAGNYNPPEKHEPLIKRNGPEYEKFYRDLLDDIITNTHLTMTEAIEKHIRESFPDEVNEDSLKETFPYMIMIDLYIRHYFTNHFLYMVYLDYSFAKYTVTIMP